MAEVAELAEAEVAEAETEKSHLCSLGAQN